MKTILIGLAKVIGRLYIFMPWVLPLRKWARNYVYNYVLQNKKPLKRLYERKPEKDAFGWKLTDVHYLSIFSPGLKGYIRYRKVNTVVFYLVVFFIWGWFDDDSNEDTTDKGYIKTLVDGSRKVNPYTPTDLIIRLNTKSLAKIDFSQVVYGNAFDLGDVRGDYPFFNWLATLAWNNRNTAMNFQYLLTDY